VRDAAAALHAADQALREDVATTIDTLARDVAARSLATENAIGATNKALRDDIGATNKGLREDIAKTLDTLALDMREHTEAMEKEFRSELKTAVATVGKMHGSAADAIAKVEATVGQLEDLQALAEKTLAEHKEGRQEAAKVRKDMQSTANQVEQIGQQVKAVMTELSDAQQTSRTLSDRFAGITSDLERLATTSGDLYTAIADLSTAQQSAAQQINEVLGRAGQTTATWQALVEATTRLSGTGTTLNSDFDRLLTKGREVAQLIERGTADAARQQAELTERVTSLNEVIVRLDAKRESHWVDRIFRGDR
jgi:chromosome segregation ATPase